MFKTFSKTFGHALIFDVRKKNNKKLMGLTERLFLCRGCTSKIFRRAAIADSAIL